MVPHRGRHHMAQSTISDLARAILALDDEETKLQQRQLELAHEQHQTWLRLEAIKEAKAKLWRNNHGYSPIPRPVDSAYHA